MDHSSHNKIISFIWSIADSCLRDVYVRGKYRDVILPMVVLRRLDTLLEDTKKKVLDEAAFQKNEMKFTEFDNAGLKNVSGYVFYNTSKWTLRSLYDTATNNQQILLQNFEEYLSGFSENVKEIIKKFELNAKIRHMASKDVLLDVLEKFVSPYINLTPHEKLDPDGYKLLPLSNLGMGYVFEELIRKFNEENNEEAGEHFTPREVINLMMHILFDPVQDNLLPVITIYDPACGSGGMLTEAQNFIKDFEKKRQDCIDVHLYGKEINDETYAICKSDMMIKGDNPSNIKNGSTLSTDSFSGTYFDFMLSNPPYGKSWSSDLKYIKDGKNTIDPRFIVKLKDYWQNEEEVDATPRSSDGQLLFLMEMISKMKSVDTKGKGSRIASVHNGSSLFTGDAGGGESNIRRYIIENDMLEAIIQLPNNLFYNTGITTYIWVLSNNKHTNRKGKVQLIEASLLFRKLRKNLGNKNCELTQDHISEIIKTYLDCSEKNRKAEEAGIASKVFDNSDFGYYKVNIERPDRRKAKFTSEGVETLRFDKTVKEPMEWAYGQWGNNIYNADVLKRHEKEIVKWCEENDISLSTKNKSRLLKIDTWKKQASIIETASMLMDQVGSREFINFNEFKSQIDKSLKVKKIKLSASEKSQILNAVSWYDETADKVIKTKSKFTNDQLGKLLNKLRCSKEDLADFGYYATEVENEFTIYETSSDLRDSENIPIKANIHKYFTREVKPHVGEAWIDMSSIKIGYEISFNKYFYRHKPLRTIEEVGAEIVALEKESDGLIAEILGINVNIVSGVIK